MQIQQANSGHPEHHMGMSPTVYCLWQRLLRDLIPRIPFEMNRDRFVLYPPGMPSTLLYTILHLAKGASGRSGVRNSRQSRASRSKTSNPSANLAAVAQDTPSTAGLPASRRPRVRWDKAWPQASALAIAEKWLAAR